MKKIVRCCVIIAITLVINAMILVGAFVGNAEKYEIKFQRNVSRENGQTSDTMIKEYFTIEKSGIYSFNLKWSSNENPGVLTGFVITDSNNNVVTSCTGDTLEISNGEYDLAAGKYCCLICTIANENDLDEFLNDYIYGTGDVVIDSEQYEYKDGEWQQSFYMSLSRVQSSLIRTCILVGVVTGFSIVAIMIVISKKDDSIKNKFDERQSVVRNKGMKIAYYILLIYCELYMIAKVCDYYIPVEDGLIIFAGVIVSIVYFAVYSIFKDCYYALNEQRERFIVFFAIMGVGNLAFYIVYVLRNGILTDGKITAVGNINGLVGLAFLTCTVSSIIKAFIDKKAEETDEES